MLWVWIGFVVVLWTTVASDGNALHAEGLTSEERVQAMALEKKPYELSPRMPQVDMRIGEHVYRLEKTITQTQAEQGLMYRTQLPENHGMLFSFQPPRMVSFWMKNTKIPLDMLFFLKNRLVYIEHSALPCLSDPCRTYGPAQLVDMVVELPGGTAYRQELQVGMSAELLHARVHSMGFSQSLTSSFHAGK